MSKRAAFLAGMVVGYFVVGRVMQEVIGLVQSRRS